MMSNRPMSAAMTPPRRCSRTGPVAMSATTMRAPLTRMASSDASQLSTAATTLTPCSRRNVRIASRYRRMGTRRTKDRSASSNSR